MGSGRRRRKQHFRRIHAFPCGRASFKDEHSLIGGPGFSRVVYCNDPDSFEASLLNYGGNYVKTSKYTVASFFPKSLFEQFRRVANLYFLLCALLSFTPLSPYSPVSNVLPLVVVIGVTMGKEALEDWRRTKQVNLESFYCQFRTTAQSFSFFFFLIFFVVIVFRIWR